MRLIFFSICFLLFISGCTDRIQIQDIKDNGQWQDMDVFEHKGIYLRDSDYIFTYFNWRYEMEEVDVETFKICKSSHYAKDINYVYYPQFVLAISTDNSFMAYIDYIIPEADPSTFKYLGDEYGIDKNNLYFKGKTIPYSSEIIRKYQHKEKD